MAMSGKKKKTKIPFEDFALRDIPNSDLQRPEIHRCFLLLAQITVGISKCETNASRTSGGTSSGFSTPEPPSRGLDQGKKDVFLGLGFISEAKFEDSVDGSGKVTILTSHRTLKNYQGDVIVSFFDNNGTGHDTYTVVGHLDPSQFDHICFIKCSAQGETFKNILKAWSDFKTCKSRLLQILEKVKFSSTLFVTISQKRGEEKKIVISTAGNIYTYTSIINDLDLYVYSCKTSCLRGSPMIVIDHIALQFGCLFNK